MRVFTLLVAVACIGGAAWAAQNETRACFSTHLQEAIASNVERAARYSELTDGRSDAISKSLTWSERLSILPALGVEASARPLQEAGIPILCTDFVSMKTTPAFQDKFEFPFPKEEEFQKPPMEEWKTELTLKLKKDGPESLHAVCLEYLKKIEKPQGFHCLVRHVLESIARVSFLAPQYVKLAKEKGVSASPEAVSRSLLSLHILSLKLASDLDVKAAPLQAEGIPILCQDVPPIETSPVLAGKSP